MLYRTCTVVFSIIFSILVSGFIMHNILESDMNRHASIYLMINLNLVISALTLHIIIKLEDKFKKV